MTRQHAAPAAIVAAPWPSDARRLRVVMVVANDVTRDSRVLREAAALTEAGHSVVVLGMMTAHTTAPTTEVRDGFVIRRLPYRAKPPGWWVPPDFYARVRAKADRQYRLHRARLVAAARGARRQRVVLTSRARRLPGTLRLTAIRRRLPAVSLGRPCRVLGRRVRPPRVHMPHWPRLALIRRRRGRRTRRMTLRREVRGYLVRAADTPLPEWPHKTRLFLGRMTARLAHIARGAASGARIALTRPPRMPRFHTPSLRLPSQRLPSLTGLVPLATARRAGRLVRRPVDRGVSALALIGGAVGAAAVPWVRIIGLVVWGSAYLLANQLSGHAIEWLTGWRWRWLGWAQYVAEMAPDADVWHGHDLTSLPAVVELKRRRGGVAIYDSHEIYVESGRHADQPRWAKAQLERLERRLAAEVDAVVTVNRSLATILAERLDRPSVEVLYNCPARYEDEEPRRSRLRSAIGLRADVPLLVYHGSLSPHRGIEQLLDAIRLPELGGAHLAFLGFGQLADWLRAEALESRYGGRVHVVDAVPPDELLDWLVGVDVGVAPIQASTLNHRYSSPNKVFEAIAAGTPVAGSDFPEFRRVITESPYGSLGGLFDPSQPAAIAAAIRRILDLPPDQRSALRRRCLAASRERWNWETESAALLDLYAGFRPQPAGTAARAAVMGAA